MSTVHDKTAEKKSLTAYGRLLWTVNILGRQWFVNGLSTVSQQLVIKYSRNTLPVSINSLTLDLDWFVLQNKQRYQLP